MKTVSAIILILAFLSAEAQLKPIEIGADGIASEIHAANAQTCAGKTDISYLDAAVLGIVEGVTEYLPVSSTGHLILANAFLNLDSNTPLLNGSGRAVLGDDLEPYTMKAAADAYVIVIQFGAILAVAILYWEYILKMLMGLLGRNPVGFRLLRNLVIAFLPAAAVGLLFHDAIECHLFGVKPVIFALAAGAVLMFAVQRFYMAKEKRRAQFVKMEDLSAKKAILVGVLQCVAMWPGTSRSMMTILGGYIAGMKPADSARFSFLLGLITLSAASMYKTYSDGSAMLEALSAGPLAFGLAVAFVSAAVSVKWMVGFLTKRGLAPFAWYRLALAAVLCAMIFFGAI